MAAPKTGKFAPKERTPELINAILDTISTQRISNAEACKKHGIGITLWKEWLNDNDDLAARYARAKEAQMELMADEILTIADDREEDANSRRVRVDSRKWLLSKLMPKKYGDRTNIEHSGGVEVGLKSLLTELDGTSLGPPSLREKPPREK